jgi:hypothetical protein
VPLAEIFEAEESVPPPLKPTVWATLGADATVCSVPEPDKLMLLEILGTTTVESVPEPERGRAAA